MFTGLIEDTGTVKAVTNSQIRIETSLDDIKPGDSIAVNGVCLTVTEISGQDLSFDYSPQTDKLTNLSRLSPGQKVNLERALKLSSRLGGHIVSGHVDYISKILGIAKLENFYKFTFSMEDSFSKYIAAKGSVTIDGISLTVSDISHKSFDVYIIPETYKNTILSSLKAGDIVNIETDILAKYTERLLGKEVKKDISEDFLKENGFI